MNAKWNETNVAKMFRKAAIARRSIPHFEIRSRSRTRRPFTRDDEIKQTLLDDTAAHVLSAVASLDLASQNAEHWADYETIIHFKNILETFLSHDNNEGGFIPAYIKEQ